MGVNICEGQTLVIRCPVECAFFARLCAAAAYRIGCREVVMQWQDDALSRMRYLYADTTVFDAVPRWEQQMLNGYAEEGAAYLAISATDPMNLSDIDPDRLQRSRAALGRDLRPSRELRMNNTIPWCIASVPIPSWAHRVFPDKDEADAMDALWDAIAAAVRVQGDGGAVARWEAHLKQLQERIERLNACNFVSLHYKNALGTDFTVDLPPEHVFQGGADLTRQGRPFVANMPTEEIFTAPLRESGRGVLCASRPLVYQGNVIRDIRFVVERGRIVEAYASTGQQILEQALQVDEGASYLGELALVPCSSPLYQQGILFYHTLFDENAACHIAFGQAYPCLLNGERMSAEELYAHGLNRSATHVDVMIGTADMQITGTLADGRQIPVFAQGDLVV